MQEINANGSIVTMAIVVEALRIAGLIPMPEMDKWAWKSGLAQRDSLIYQGYAKLTMLAADVDASADTKFRPAPWYLCGISVDTIRSMPKDLLELWHEDERVISIHNLAVPSLFHEEPNGKATTVR